MRERGWPHPCGSRSGTFPPRSSHLVKILFELADSNGDNAAGAKISRILADVYDSSLSPAYLDALQSSPHAMIRRMAARVLERILSRDDKERPEVMNLLLSDSDPDVRSSAAFYGTAIGDASVIPLLEQLTGDPDKLTRSRAIEGLVKFMPATFDFLSSLLLQDSPGPDWEDSRNICRALNTSAKKAETVSVLVTALQAQNPHAISNAMEVLYELDKKSALWELRRIIKGENQQIRAAAIESASSDDPETCEILLGILGSDEESEEMRERALCKLTYPLSAKGKPEIKSALDSILKREGTPNDLRQRIIEIMASGDHDIFREILSDPRVCGMAMEVASKRDIETRIALLTEPGNARVPRDCRIGIIMSLRDTTDPSAIERIKKLTTDNDPALRAAVASTLGEISSSVTLPALEKMLNDPDPDVREKAKAAITTIRIRFTFDDRQLFSLFRRSLWIGATTCKLGKG